MRPVASGKHRGQAGELGLALPACPPARPPARPAREKDSVPAPRDGPAQVRPRLASVGQGQQQRRVAAVVTPVEEGGREGKRAWTNASSFSSFLRSPGLGLGLDS